MIKRKKPRFSTAEAIEKAIDQTREQQTCNAAEANKTDNEADALVEWFKTNDRANCLTKKAIADFDGKVFLLKSLRSKAEKLRKAHPKYERRLLRLKKTLQAFNTEPLAIIDDRSVCLQ